MNKFTGCNSQALKALIWILQIVIDTLQDVLYLVHVDN
jgi:hypothetical protein